MVMPELQEAVPAGIITVSPSAARTMAAVTSAREGLAALIVAACPAFEAAKSSVARTVDFRRFVFNRVDGNQRNL